MIPQIAVVTAYGIMLPCDRFSADATGVEGLIGWAVGWAWINLDVL